MQSSMSDLTFDVMLANPYGIFVLALDFQQHQERLKKVLERLRTLGLKLNPDKCHTCVRKVET